MEMASQPSSQMAPAMSSAPPSRYRVTGLTWDCSLVPARFNSCLTPTTRTSHIRPAKLPIQLPTAIVFRQLSRMVGWTFELESRPETWYSKAALAVSQGQVEELQS